MRLRLVLLAFLTVAAGLGSRRLGLYAEIGDALYGTLILVLVHLIGLRPAPWVAYGACVAVEVSQLWPALDPLRATRLGGLVLGHGFVWADLVAYAVGVAAGQVVVLGLRRTLPGALRTESGGSPDGRDGPLTP